MAMSDPFDRLRLDDAPIQPDPAFASHLRDRLSRALVLPKGVTVSNLTIDQRVGHATGEARPPAIRGQASITVYLAVAGAQEAIAWYGDALGAALTGDPIVMPDGRVGHAELDVAGARLMLSEEHPEIGVVAPSVDGGATFTIYLSVEDVDEVIGRSVAAGAVLERAAADYEYGRNGVIRDPFGHRWMVSSEPEPEPEPSAGAGLRHGDIGYVSLWVPDVGRAATFFAAVLGWRYEGGDSSEDRQVVGRRVSDHHLHHGLWGGVDQSTLFCCYAVDDVVAAAERIRAAGGTASEPHDEPYGRLVEGIDPGGSHFAVFTPPGGTVAGPATPHRQGEGGRQGVQGDVIYVTMEVPDSALVRRFYGSVLGWRTSPGRVADGWNVEGVSPMVGLAGGLPKAATVPMYQVDDIRAAVGRVRAAGGTATEPEAQPYGITSEAADDQGTRFYLGLMPAAEPT
jgi:predicted enzyme related to lactoylglutathione lyase